MKKALIFYGFFLTTTLSAQQVYTITADSTKLTGCDSNELIIENHTQAVPGFLFNTGKGRTAFKRPLTKISDTIYLVGADTLKIRNPNAWLQGGNRFGVDGKLGTLDKTNLDFYSFNNRVARIDTLGCLLVALTANANIGLKLDVGGPARVLNTSIVTANDTYDIKFVPHYAGSYMPGVDGSVMTWGPGYGYIGINKQAFGTIPANSLLIGRASPFHYTAITDYNSNPVFVVDGNGLTTINGGYTGIGPGGSPGVGINANAQVFSINGSRGTGTGNLGDIVFSTGTVQASGSTIHTMSNRWWLKGGTGYLSNTSTPTSAVDVTGSNGYSQLRMRTTYTPGSTADTNGNTGDFSWDGNFFYIKTPTGWKRAALTAF